MNFSANSEVLNPHFSKDTLDFTTKNLFFTIILHTQHLSPHATMADHDLSALDGLLDDLDIEEKDSSIDPRAAKLKALFLKAKAEYTAKIDYPTWYIPTTSSTAPLDIDTFTIPSPSELLGQRKTDKTGTTNQEWTVNYLYTQGHFEKCLGYVVSFAVSMGIEFPFGEEGEGGGEVREHDSSQVALRRSKQERELSKNWGVIKDIIDAGIRSLLTLLRKSSHATTIDTWIPSPSPSATATFTWGAVSLSTLSRGFLTFCMREIRVGAGDSRSGYSGLVIPSPSQPPIPMVDMEKLKLQNWTVTHGLALTAGDLALEMGLYLTAIEAHTLFLACRGQMWRVLLALASELSSYLTSLSNQSSSVSSASLEALKVVAKASVVSALQAVPRPRRLELAQVVLLEHKVIPSDWISEALREDYVEKAGFEDEDELLFDGLLQPLGAGRNWHSTGQGYICKEEWVVCDLSKVSYIHAGV